MEVLVDTTVWSLSLRRSPGMLNHHERSLDAELLELIREGRVRLIGAIRQELLSGIREKAQFARVQQALRAYEDEPLATEDYESAARLSNQCRAAGIIGSGVDFLICAVAHRRSWEVFTIDKDFQSYVRVIPVALHAPRISGRVSKGRLGEGTIQ